MSERGSFVTAYIYCPKCFDTLKNFLEGDREYYGGMSRGYVIPGTPIIAGYLSALGLGDEASRFKSEVEYKLGTKLCHRVTIVAITEGGMVLPFTLGMDEDEDSNNWYGNHPIDDIDDIYDD